MTACGTRAGYQAGCRCLCCRAANASYAQAQRKQHDPGFVDAGPVAAHLAALRARGMGVPRIATVSGVSAATIWQLFAGTRTTVRRETAEALLAVPYRPALGAIASSVTAWRYVRLLRLDGYSDEIIAQAVGAHRLRFGRTRARVRTVLRIVRFYRTHVEEPSDADDHAPMGGSAE